MDIVGLLRGQIEGLLKQAKEAEAAGQLAKAASLYQKAAVLQHQYTDRVQEPGGKRSARDSAERWEQYAQVLLTNPPPPHRSPSLGPPPGGLG